MDDLELYTYLTFKMKQCDALLSQQKKHEEGLDFLAGTVMKIEHVTHILYKQVPDDYWNEHSEELEKHQEYEAKQQERKERMKHQCVETQEIKDKLSNMRKQYSEERARVRLRLEKKKD